MHILSFLCYTWYNKIFVILFIIHNHSVTFWRVCIETLQNSWHYIIHSTSHVQHKQYAADHCVYIHLNNILLYAQTKYHGHKPVWRLSSAKYWLPFLSLICVFNRMCCQSMTCVYFCTLATNCALNAWFILHKAIMQCNIILINQYVRKSCSKCGCEMLHAFRTQYFVMHNINY